MPAGPSDVLTSAQATAAMLRTEGWTGRTAFVVGERGIREALGQAGVEVVDGEPDRTDLVVVGWDRQATYDKLKQGLPNSVSMRRLHGFQTRQSLLTHEDSSAPDTDWVVKLCDVHPDGRTLNICDGVLRASYRRSSSERSPVEPGAVDRYDVDLWATSMLFRRGHRLRVLLTSSDFPRYDRNPNTGALGVEAAGGEPALQRVFHDAQRPSHLVLPVVPG